MKPSSREGPQNRLVSGGHLQPHLGLTLGKGLAQPPTFSGPACFRPLNPEVQKPCTGVFSFLLQAENRRQTASRRHRPCLPHAEPLVFGFSAAGEVRLQCSDGYGTGDMVSMWMSSDTSRAQLLNSGFTFAGIGIYDHDGIRHIVCIVTG